MSRVLKILVINPNSSAAITEALKRSLLPTCPNHINLTFYNPLTGPPGIKDEQTAQESTNACLAEFTAIPPRIDISEYDGALVACFSEHPLIDRLTDLYRSIGRPGKVVGIYHAAVAFALLTSGRFGILATGTGVKTNLIKATSTFLGSDDSDRFAGALTTGLQIVELQDKNFVEKVENGMKTTTKRLLDNDAKTVIFGCAGMSGMERWVQQVAEQEGKEVRIIDGVKAGMYMLASLIGS